MPETKLQRFNTTNALKIFLFLFIVHCTLLIPNGRDCFSQSQFQLAIGDSTHSEEARSIIQTTDGGYIAVGESDWPGGDMYIVKLNSSGQLQWNRTIGGTGQSIALSVIQTTDGGYAVSGFGGSLVFGAYIVKLTQEGSVEWTRVLDDGFGDPAWSVVQTTDGGYTAAMSPVEGGGSYRMIIVKLDNMGIPQWSKSIQGWSYARCIRQTTDKGYVVAGATRSFGAGDFDMFVVKLDSNGTLQWAKTIGGTSEDFAYSIVQTTDGGYAVAGKTVSFKTGDAMYITKLDSSGMLQWMKVVAVNLDCAYSIVQTTDGGYAVAGYTGGGGGMLIVKLNPDGLVQWSRRVGGGSGQTYAYSIIQTTDGGYTAAGFSSFFAAGGGMFIVKLDNNGNTCGNSISHSISVETGGILGGPTPIITNIALTDTTPTPTTGSFGSVTQICVIGIQPVSSEIPASYRLYQNYPNPFNPLTKIRFDIPSLIRRGAGVVVLKIYDLLGSEIAVLVNQNLHSGTYEVEWDGKNYASGVYYYKFSIVNNKLSVEYEETKRMVLIK